MTLLLQSIHTRVYYRLKFMVSFHSKEVTHFFPAPKRPENGPSKVVMQTTNRVQKATVTKEQKTRPVPAVSKVNDNGIMVENDDQIESAICELVRQASSSRPLTINIFKSGESVEAKFAEIKAETKKLENLKKEVKAIVESRNSLQKSIIDLVATFK